jgi:hypothetical protein
VRRALAFGGVGALLLVGLPVSVALVGGYGQASAQTCLTPAGGSGHAATALAVGTRLRASERVLTAALEAGLVESRMANLANDGKRGSEDRAASDAELAVAATSLAFPHDGVGSDNDSVGVLQQRNSWGAVADRMNPEWAFGEFYKRAIALDESGFGGTAGDLARAVQGSAFPDRYELALPDANALLAGLAGSLPVGCATVPGGPPVAGIPPGYGTPGPCGLSPATDYTRQLVETTFRIHDIGGCAYSGHVENSYHYPDANGQAHALDVMTYQDVALGDRVAAWAVANVDALRIVETIFNHRIWTPARGWHPYPCPASNATLCHEDHVHVSIDRSA